MNGISTKIVSISDFSTDPENRTPEEIRQDISLHQAAISNTISRLDERVQEAVDWRTHVAAHPYVALGLATGAGMLLVNLFRRQASPQERMMTAFADSFEDICGQAQDRFGTLLDVAAPRQKSVFQGALLGFAAKAVTTYLLGKIDSNTPPSTTQIK